MSRIVSVVALGRLRTCSVVCLASLLGSVMAGGSPVGRGAISSVLVAFAFAFVSNLDNSLTDTAEDAINLPARQAMVASATDRLIRRCAFAMSVTACVIALTVDAMVGAIACAMFVALPQYSRPPVRAKARPVLGVVFFSHIVLLPYILGFLAADASAWLTDVVPLPGTADGFIVAVYLFQWFSAKAFVKNVPDYEGDRRSGVRTTATVFASPDAAARVAACVSFLSYLVVLVPIALGALPRASLVALAFLPVVAVSGTLLVRPPRGRTRNEVLKWDMLISCGFLVALILSVDPSLGTALVGAAVFALIPLSDLTAVDSRIEVAVR